MNEHRCASCNCRIDQEISKWARLDGVGHEKDWGGMPSGLFCASCFRDTLDDSAGRIAGDKIDNAQSEGYDDGLAKGSLMRQDAFDDMNRAADTLGELLDDAKSAAQEVEDAIKDGEGPEGLAQLGMYASALIAQSLEAFNDMSMAIGDAEHGNDCQRKADEPSSGRAADAKKRREQARKDARRRGKIDDYAPR